RPAATGKSSADAAPPPSRRKGGSDGRGRPGLQGCRALVPPAQILGMPILDCDVAPATRRRRPRVAALLERPSHSLLSPPRGRARRSRQPSRTTPHSEEPPLPAHPTRSPADPQTARVPPRYSRRPPPRRPLHDTAP